MKINVSFIQKQSKATDKAMTGRRLPSASLKALTEVPRVPRVPRVPQKQEIVQIEQKPFGYEQKPFEYDQEELMIMEFLENQLLEGCDQAYEIVQVHDDRSFTCNVYQVALGTEITEETSVIDITDE